jgi:hypothetical protein
MMTPKTQPDSFSAQAFYERIKVGFKGLRWTNGLTYFIPSSVTKKKVLLQ